MTVKEIEMQHLMFSLLVTFVPAQKNTSRFHRSGFPIISSSLSSAIPRCTACRAPTASYQRLTWGNHRSQFHGANARPPTDRQPYPQSNTHPPSNLNGQGVCPSRHKGALFHSDSDLLHREWAQGHNPENDRTAQTSVQHGQPGT